MKAYQCFFNRISPGDIDQIAFSLNLRDDVCLNIFLVMLDFTKRDHIIRPQKQQINLKFGIRLCEIWALFYPIQDLIENRLTNAVAEGIDRIIKIIKKQSQ